VLASLAGALPLPPEARDAIRAASPRGVVSDLRASWSGALEAPAHYRLAGRFEDLAARAQSGLPGFDRLSGRFDLTEAHGQASVRGQAAHVVVGSTTFDWDRLAIELNWDGSLLAGTGPTQLRLVRGDVTNREVSGSVTGRWRGASGRARAELDLTVDLQRAELRQLHRYLPPIDPDLDGWLRTALLGGQINGAQIRWKGRPDEPELGAPGNALLEVTARAERASLNPAPGWPTIEELNGTFTIRDRELRVLAGTARTQGIALREASVRIADLAQPRPVLQASGWAEADTAEMLRYVADTPVRSAIGGRLEGLVVEGRG
jgi:uncharacterized protein YhdP